MRGAADRRLRMASRPFVESERDFTESLADRNNEDECPRLIAETANRGIVASAVSKLDTQVTAARAVLNRFNHLGGTGIVPTLNSVQTEFADSIKT